MNKLYKVTITSMTLAACCALSGLAIEAEASLLNSTNVETNVEQNIGDRHSSQHLNASLPSLATLGLAVAPPTAATAQKAQAIHSRLLFGLATNDATERHSAQSEALLVAASPSRLVDSQPLQAVASPAVQSPSHTTATASILAQANTAASPSDEEIRQQLLTTPNRSTEPASDLDVLDRRPQPIPSSSFITPNAYGADWGDFYTGFAGATEDTNDGLDASASVGMGFGNAVDNVGVELNVGIISIDGFADDGTVGFKVHKLFPEANNLGVAVGWSNALKWGNANKDEETIYGVVTQRFDLRPNKDNPMPLTTSLGVGTGAFRSVGAIEAGNNTPNVFGSVGVRVIPQVSLVSSWNGSSLGLAASAAPFNFPVVVTAGVSDLTDNTEDGTQFVGGLGYSFGF